MSAKNNGEVNHYEVNFEGVNDQITIRRPTFDVSNDDAQAVSNNQSPEIITDHHKTALSKIDNAKFSCFHVRAVLVSGVGFFTVIMMNET